MGLLIRIVVVAACAGGFAFAIAQPSKPAPAPAPRAPPAPRPSPGATCAFDRAPPPTPPEPVDATVRIEPARKAAIVAAEEARVRAELAELSRTEPEKARRLERQRLDQLDASRALIRPVVPPRPRPRVAPPPRAAPR